MHWGPREIYGSSCSLVGLVTLPPLCSVLLLAWEDGCTLYMVAGLGEGLACRERETSREFPQLQKREGG